MKKLLLIGLCFCLYGPVGAPAAPRPNAPTITGALRQSIDLARSKVYPALVNISVVVRYFNAGRAQRQRAGGSGVIVSKDGYVLTNYHVAGHTTRITCTMPSGESLEASVVTHDPQTDISVLKLQLDRRANPGTALPFARLGNSDNLKVGDFVLAMGNPLLLSSSMTLGIVSNTRRVFTDVTNADMQDVELENGERTGLFTRWIQHDALILPGNSGGPLVNLDGEVVGINELGGNGVGFAIPSNIAANVLRQALKYGEVRRGWIGLTVLPVNKMGRTTGALVSFVAPRSPAAKVGIKAGDILVSLSGAPTNVRFFEEVPLLYQRVAALPIGKPAKLVYLRDGKTFSVNVPVVQMEHYLGEEQEFRQMGMTAQDITGPMALMMHLPDIHGVVVTGVRAGYPFETARPSLDEGDVIESVDNKPTPDLAALRKALAAADKKQIVVTFRRAAQQLMTVASVPPEQSPDEGGELPQAWIGIKTQVLTPDVAAALGAAGTHGFRISEVYPGTEASKAGLRVGDLVTALNGDKLDSYRQQDAEDLRRAVEDLGIGTKVQLTVLRGGTAIQTPVTLEATPTSAAQARKVEQKQFEFTVREMMPLDRMENPWERDEKGVIVVDVVTGGWASISGLQPEDVILTINGQPIEDLNGFGTVMKKIMAARPKYIQLFVNRGYRTHFIFIEPDWDKLTRTG